MMVDQRDRNLNELRDRITVAGYEVDPVAVADAIVRRRWSVAVAPQPGPAPSMRSRRSSRARVSCIARRVHGTRALAA
jgi:hypothetical protein